jgi:hypothetical protein
MSTLIKPKQECVWFVDEDLKGKFSGMCKSQEIINTFMGIVRLAQAILVFLLLLLN